LKRATVPMEGAGLEPEPASMPSITSANDVESRNPARASVPADRWRATATDDQPKSHSAGAVASGAQHDVRARSEEARAASLSR
jgi:hypothetical protein